MANININENDTNKGAKIYIDEANWYHRGKYYAHMWSPDYKTLHAFAQQLGIKKHWFHHTTYPHYDVNAITRSLAIEAGAIPVDSKVLIKMMRQNTSGLFSL